MARLERVHNILFQATHSVGARMYWEAKSWARHSQPSDHNAVSVAARRDAIISSLLALSPSSAPIPPLPLVSPAKFGRVCSAETWIHRFMITRSNPFSAYTFIDPWEPAVAIPPSANTIWALSTAVVRYEHTQEGCKPVSLEVTPSGVAPPAG